MKQLIFKSRDELPMFLTVMDVANLLGISRASAYSLEHVICLGYEKNNGKEVIFSG